MNISKNTHKPMYICDKCGKEINYTYRVGRNVYKYYKYNPKSYAPAKDFDLCCICEKKLREWLKEKELPTTKNLLDRFDIWEE